MYPGCTLGPGLMGGASGGGTRAGRPGGRTEAAAGGGARPEGPAGGMGGLADWRIIRRDCLSSSATLVYVGVASTMDR